MKKFTKELGPGWITLVENDDYALCRLIFGDGLEVDADEEETPLLKKGFQNINLTAEGWLRQRSKILNRFLQLSMSYNLVLFLVFWINPFDPVKK